MFDKTTLTAPADDGKILEIFHQWQDAERALAAIGQREPDDGDPEFDAAVDEVMRLEHAIARTPAAGAEGLAVKIFMRQHLERFWAGGDPCALDPLLAEDGYTEGCVDLPLIRGLIADAVRLVPELAPLAAPIVGQPVIGFGE
jgi:hypothetical protein